jgi:hypothetical protein
MLLLPGADAQEEATPSITDLLREQTLKQSSPSFLSFQSNTVYICTSHYRLSGANEQHQQLSDKEKEKSRFEMIFNEDFSRLQTSDAMVYAAVRSTAKGRLYSKKVALQGKTVYYKIRVFSTKGIYKSVFVPGYGNLIHDFVQCESKEI